MLRTMRLELVEIPAGSFRMGSDGGAPDERPVHEVALAAFAIAVVPVTNAEYRRFVAATAHREPPTWGDERFVDAAQPVVAVSWFDAAAYCTWLAEVSGRACRLPSEAERERAATGGIDGIRYPWGEHELANGATAPALPRAGLGTANAFGLHNMGDLVHEWCSDWYDAGYYAISPRQDPRGPSQGTRRSSRGGSWRHRAPFTRCAARSSLAPHLTYADYGFRVAADLRAFTR
jgi:formylglycine-generating enzyme required for sulfatase activity